MKFEKGMMLDRKELLRDLVNRYFTRTPADISPGQFRATGNNVEIMPTSERVVYRMVIKENILERIEKIDAVTRSIIDTPESFYLFPAKHFVTPDDEKERALSDIKKELAAQLKHFEVEGKPLEAERLKRRTGHDLALIREVGYCNGIENYSRHFDGRSPGEPPSTLLSYFPKNKKGEPDFLTIIDESHVTVPQISGMYFGDRSRKENLVEYGFRLPSAVDNRPLKFDEFEARVGQTIYTSATPGKFEIEHSKSPEGKVVEQIIRPTGLVDPQIIVRPVSATKNYEGQIKDFIAETEKTVAGGGRVLVTTLTKKMAEDLAEFLKEKNIKAEYLHSDVKTIERIDILTNFRRGTFDVVVGVNLLREGLDLPEVELVAILDADKEGFLRSETSLIQTIGRAARNLKGYVLLYADVGTGSMEKAIGETNRRRAIQVAYNKEHNITPKSIIKKIGDISADMRSEHQKAVDMLIELDRGSGKPKRVLIAEKRRQMNDAVKELDFETAAILRDEIQALEGSALKKKK
jgi:excinuclease ABC subunit B